MSKKNNFASKITNPNFRKAFNPNNNNNNNENYVVGNSEFSYNNNNNNSKKKNNNNINYSSYDNKKIQPLSENKTAHQHPFGQPKNQLKLLNKNLINLF